MEREDEPGVVRRGLEVECVEIIDILESEDACEGKKEVEAKDEDVVSQHEGVELFLIADRGYQAWQRVVTHEAATEQYSHCRASTQTSFKY